MVSRDYRSPTANLCRAGGSKEFIDNVNFMPRACLVDVSPSEDLDTSVALSGKLVRLSGLHRGPLCQPRSRDVVDGSSAIGRRACQTGWHDDARYVDSGHGDPRCGHAGCYNNWCDGGQASASETCGARRVLGTYHNGSQAANASHGDTGRWTSARSAVYGWHGPTSSDRHGPQSGTASPNGPSILQSLYSWAIPVGSSSRHTLGQRIRTQYSARMRSMSCSPSRYESRHDTPHSACA